MTESTGKAELILASGSPRRRDLLAAAGFRFRVENPGIEENEDTSLPIRLLTAENARDKAVAVSARFPEAVVIAADTLVLLGETVLSKPADLAEAARMLESLSGGNHEVFTAVAIRHGQTGREVDFTETTSVHFKTLTPDQRAEYHRRIDPLDKAGAYAAQEHGDLIIDQIEGSMSNVIGLPMDEVIRVLRDDFGITPDPLATDPR
ncbi:MAG: septum formation protein Maf [Verrucomicrobiae bacterium]|nr:septum formation protein Maf [Verrucomicrobiae bacterium]